jgi:hypothetical protein
LPGDALLLDPCSRVIDSQGGLVTTVAVERTSADVNRRGSLEKMATYPRTPSPMARGMHARLSTSSCSRSASIPGDTRGSLRSRMTIGSVDVRRESSISQYPVGHAAPTVLGFGHESSLLMALSTVRSVGAKV